MTPRLLLNSTKPKDYVRNAREVCGECVCPILYPPCIYSRETRARTFTTNVRDNGEAPHALVEAIGPTGQVGRPGRSVSLLVPPTAPNFFWQAVLGLLV